MNCNNFEHLYESLLVDDTYLGNLKPDGLVGEWRRDNQNVAHWCVPKKSPTDNIKRLTLSAIGSVSNAALNMAPLGAYKGMRNNFSLIRTRRTAMLNEPAAQSSFRLDQDLSNVVKNLNDIVEKATLENVELLYNDSPNGINQSETTRSFKFGSPVFVERPPGVPSNSHTAIRPYILPSEVDLKDWKDILDKYNRTDINVFDLDGNRVPDDDVQDRLKDATVLVSFTLRLWKFKERATNVCADIFSVIILYQSTIEPPTAPFHSKFINSSSSAHLRQVSSPKNQMMPNLLANPVDGLRTLPNTTITPSSAPAPHGLPINSIGDADGHDIVSSTPYVAPLGPGPGVVSAPHGVHPSRFLPPYPLPSHPSRASTGTVLSKPDPALRRADPAVNPSGFLPPYPPPSLSSLAAATVMSVGRGSIDAPQFSPHYATIDAAYETRIPDRHSIKTQMSSHSLPQGHIMSRTSVSNIGTASSLPLTSDETSADGTTGLHPNYASDQFQERPPSAHPGTVNRSSAQTTPGIIYDQATNTYYRLSPLDPHVGRTPNAVMSDNDGADALNRMLEEYYRLIQHGALSGPGVLTTRPVYPKYNLYTRQVLLLLNGHQFPNVRLVGNTIDITGVPAVRTNDDIVPSALKHTDVYDTIHEGQPPVETSEDMFAVHKPEYAPSLAGSRTHTPIPQQRASVPQEDTVPPLFMPHHTPTPQPFISPLHPVRSPNTSECSAIAVSQLQSPPQAVSAHQEISQHQSMTPHHFGQQVMSGVLLAPPPQTLAPVSSGSLCLPPITPLLTIIVQITSLWKV
ncbi:hypothetical protein F5880DRAFT_1617383 [Lentinula raphanica]|nr:hypothetical protein F5880DRAFT_1617383 [Lentinula raphanica]